MEIVVLPSMTHVKPINTVRGQNKKILNVKAGGTCTGANSKSGRLETRPKSDQIFSEPEMVNVLRYQNMQMHHCNMMC